MLSDEVYRGAELDGHETPSMWGRSDRVIVTSGLSKAYGLPGLRIGWIAAPASFVASTWSYHDYTTIAPGALSDRLARVALQPDRRPALLERTRGIMRANLPLIERWLHDHDPAFSWIRPEAGAIFYVRYNYRINSTELVTRLRDEKSVLVVPGDHFGMDGYLRLGLRRAAGVSAGRPRAAPSAADVIARGRVRGIACMNEPELSLALVGFGNVARRFVRLLDESAIASISRGGSSPSRPSTTAASSNVDGIDAARALAMVEASQSLDRLDADRASAAASIVIRQVTELLADECGDGRLVVVETTTLDIDRGEPAAAHVRASLEGLAHVVTANKGPVAFAYDELDALADSVDRVFFFEGAVMDGVPVFNLVRETMPAVTIDGFRGVINTTCHYVLSELERGMRFDDAIAEMQARGIAEADPSHDIDGWDAAAKTAALVNVLMGGAITPHDVARTGIRDVSAREVADAVARGRRVRLVASASRHGGRLDARVEPELLDLSDPLATLGGLENALYLHTDLLGDVGIVQRTSSLTQTAYALLSDLSHISRRLQELSSSAARIEASDDLVADRRSGGTVR